MGNLSSKLIFGGICDKLGTRKASALFTALLIVSLALFLSVGDNRLLLTSAAYLLGFAFSLSAVGWSSLSMEVFGRDGFEIPYGKVCMVRNFVMAAYLYLIGAVFDGTGSFRLVFIISIGVGLVSLAALLLWRFGRTEKEKKTEQA